LQCRRAYRPLHVPAYAEGPGGELLGVADEVLAEPAAGQALATAACDAVLRDYDLDDGKGTDLIAVIRQLPTRPAVVAVSAHDAGNQALLQAGADVACGKLRFAEIEAVLGRACGRTP